MLARYGRCFCPAGARSASARTRSSTPKMLGGGLADVSPRPWPCFGEQLVEGLDLAHRMRWKQLPARVREVFAQVVVHRHAGAGISCLHHLGDQGTQPPQVAPGLAAGLHPRRWWKRHPHRRWSALGDVAGADLALSGRVHAPGRPFCPLDGRIEELRVGGRAMPFSAICLAGCRTRPRRPPARRPAGSLPSR